LTCLVLLSCKFANQTIIQIATATPPPTATSSPQPANTLTLSPTPTNTPFPTDTPTPVPPPTKPPIPSKALPVPTNTPGLSIVTVVNNLNVPIQLSLNGPASKSFTVRAKSSFTIEIPPGEYSYYCKATNFYPTDGKITFPPGPFTWTWGKAKP
jgi:hypothetical protein